VGVIPSSEYGWQLLSIVVSRASEYEWKDPDRGKLPGVDLPVGSDEESPKDSVCVPSGKISSAEHQMGGSERGKSLQ